MREKHKVLIVANMLPLLVLVLFAPQALYVFFGYSDEISFVIIVLLTVFYFFYYASFLAGHIFFIKKRLLFNKRSQFLVLTGLTFLLISYTFLFVDFGSIPLISYIVDGGVSNALRADFYKEKTGLAKLFVYTRSIVTKGLMPIIVLFLLQYYKRTTFVVIYLLLILVSVAALEKSMIIWFVIPVFFYFVFNKKYMRALGQVGVLVLVVALMSILTIGVGNENLSKKDSGDESHHSGAYLNFVHLNGTGVYKNGSGRVNTCYVESSEKGLTYVSSIERYRSYQFLISDQFEQSTLGFMLNRILWIPYITAHDTLLYSNRKYGENLISFSVNRYLARLFGYEYASLEREVFRFQYGGGLLSKGNANAAFFAEAYVGFGLIGVCVFSIFIGLFFSWVTKGGDTILMASSMVYPIALVSSSLISMLFSGGMIFYLLAIVFIGRAYK